MGDPVKPTDDGLLMLDAIVLHARRHRMATAHVALTEALSYFDKGDESGHQVALEEMLKAKRELDGLWRELRQEDKDRKAEGRRALEGERP